MNKFVKKKRPHQPEEDEISNKKRKVTEKLDVSTNIITTQSNKKKFIFLTWNVWFNEEVALVKRIEAIGNIIICSEGDISEF